MFEIMKVNCIKFSKKARGNEPIFCIVQTKLKCI